MLVSIHKQYADFLIIWYTLHPRVAAGWSLFLIIIEIKVLYISSKWATFILLSTLIESELLICYTAGFIFQGVNVAHVEFEICFCRNAHSLQNFLFNMHGYKLSYNVNNLMYMRKAVFQLHKHHNSYY